MPKFIQVERKGHTLVPANPWAYELIEQFPEGKVLNLPLTVARSQGELNLYWAGITVLLETAFSDEDEKRWPTARKYHEAMLDSLGYTYKLWKRDRDAPSGYSFRMVIDSIAFENMADDEFKPLFERVRALTVEMFGVDPWDEWLQQRGSDWITWWEKKRRNWRPGDKDD